MKTKPNLVGFGIIRVCHSLSVIIFKANYLKVIYHKHFDRMLFHLHVNKC